MNYLEVVHWVAPTRYCLNYFSFMPTGMRKGILCFIHPEIMPRTTIHILQNMTSARYYCNTTFTQPTEYIVINLLHSALMLVGMIQLFWYKIELNLLIQVHRSVMVLPPPLTSAFLVEICYNINTYHFMIISSMAAWYQFELHIINIAVKGEIRKKCLVHLRCSAYNTQWDNLADDSKLC